MASIDPKLEPAMKDMLKMQLEEMQKEIEAMKKQGGNETLNAILQANQQQAAALIAALSRPKPAIALELGGCVIF